MRALVTGAGGFLGGAVASQLVNRGVEVLSYSRGVYPRLETLGIEHFRGSLSDREALAAAVRRAEVVFHVAAKAGIWGKWSDFYESNLLGTRHVLEACRAAGVRRLIYTSSPSVVFGGGDMEGANEAEPYPRRFKAAYPASKAAAEQLVLAANGPELATVSLRPHLIWGPGDTHLTPGILARAKADQLRRIGKSNKRVDFTYIDNAAAAHLCACDRLAPGSPISGRAFFISQAEPMPLWGFVDRVLNCAGLPPVRKSVSRPLAYAMAGLLELIYTVLPLKGEPRLTRFLVEELSTAHWFDISAARTALGYQPTVSMEEGFRRLQKSLCASG